MIYEDGESEEVLRADEQLHDRLRAVVCAGPLWNQVAVELVRYGWSVMSAWLNTGIIANKCWEKGRPVELPHDWTIQDREDLVSDAVAEGLEMFRQAVLTDRWKPEKGASLRTYFLGSCVLAFPNVLRRWNSDRRRYSRAGVRWAREPTEHGFGVEPVELLVAVHALKSLIGDENQRDQAIRFLCFHGYTPMEIAEILGMKPGAVNTALYRMRRRGLSEDGGR
jgi:DNA-directed RNA polymerase specialized sigma24 family protein